MEFVLELRVDSLVFWLLTAIWASERWLLGGRLLKIRTRSGTLELALILAAMLLALALSATAHRYDLGVLAGAAGLLVRWTGLALFAAGVALRFWAGSVLGQWFTRDLVVSPQQELVTRGPYRAIRHPLYAALLLIAAGLGCLFSTPLPALLGTLLVAAALVPRIRREERLLEEGIGQAYRDWAEQRARLVPHLL